MSGTFYYDLTSSTFLFFSLFCSSFVMVRPEASRKELIGDKFRLLLKGEFSFFLLSCLFVVVQAEKRQAEHMIEKPELHFTAENRITEPVTELHRTSKTTNKSLVKGLHGSPFLFQNVPDYDFRCTLYSEFARFKWRRDSHGSSFQKRQGLESLL